MMAEIVKLIWHAKQGDTIHALELGLLFRPMDVKIPPYKAEYDALLKQINQLLAEA